MSYQGDFEAEVAASAGSRSAGVEEHSNGSGEGDHKGSDHKKSKKKKEKKEKKAKKEKKKERKEKKVEKVDEDTVGDLVDHRHSGSHFLSPGKVTKTHASGFETNTPRTEKTSRTDKTDKTSTTMSSMESLTESLPGMIEYVQDEQRVSVVPDPNDTTQSAAFHGEMLQSFLKRHGQEDKMAIEQAMLFEAFLKSQQDALGHLTQTTTPQPTVLPADVHPNPEPLQAYDQDDEEDTRLDNIESLLDENDSFVDHWENGTFASFSRKGDDATIEKQKLMEEAFGFMKRNEAFMRTKTSQRDEFGFEEEHIVPRHMMKPPPPSSQTSFNEEKSTRSQISGKSEDSGRGGGTTASTERTIEEQIELLTASQKSCFYSVKSSWEAGEGKNKPFSDEYLLRFCKCSPGNKPFNAKAALKVMRKFERRYLSLGVANLESQLRTKAVFPCPGLRTAAGRDVFFMKMSRYSPKQTPVSTIIDNIVYVMNCMMEKERTSNDGIALVADLTDFRMVHFTVQYLNKLLTALQGRKNPTRVSLFLLVNPPSWFGSIYSTVMQPMISDDFRKRVHRVDEQDLRKFMVKGFEKRLPSELKIGKASSDEIVKNFISTRKEIEANRRIPK